ncbi:hypothetical protein NC653_036996 [Populus alba x Populus x berolinensis]|uniref:Pyrrolo-quinoline quinone repeat domain-containing protein n=1 Tax=Populus alba x Populus x berolinensis TaxID=444605 RepID=A0AAD6LLG5_9ROSI|nr:hypothetical protein NC653_036996 [Populus alba x Populus x berolinensis]
MAYLETKKYLSSTIGFLVIVLCLFPAMDDATAVWLNHGADIRNTRSAKGEVLINRLTVKNLRLKWTFFAGKDISATPAIANGVVYFPSWNGFLYAVNAFNGALIWKQNLGQLTGLNGTGIVVNVTVSRSTPTIADDLLLVGIYGPAVVIAVTRATGRLVWSTQLDPRPRAQITQSGTFYDGAFYVGVSSLEVGLPANQCCTFRGSMAKLNVRTDTTIWRTYTLPDNEGQLGGYSGAAIWGSSPAIDVTRRLVYVGTGNLYTAPREVTQCQEAQNNQTTKPAQPDLSSGQISTSTQFWLSISILEGLNGPNLDADFGEAPMLLTITANRTRRDVAVAVQKSGFAWALDRDDGSIVWSKGGGIWGAATDERTVYTNIANSNRERFTLALSNQTTTVGAWVALDANSGQILWSTANPSNEAAQGPVTIVNDVLFAGSVAPYGPIYAMDAKTGNILWSYDTGATVYGGVSASYGCIYLGNGYSIGLARFHPSWTGGTSLYAFCVA